MAFSNPVLHTFSTFAPYGCHVTLPKVCKESEPEPSIIIILYGWSGINGDYILPSIENKTEHNVRNENKTERNLKWPSIPDHPSDHRYKILIMGGSSVYTLWASLLNLCYNFNIFSFFTKRFL